MKFLLRNIATEPKALAFVDRSRKSPLAEEGIHALSCAGRLSVEASRSILKEKGCPAPIACMAHMPAPRQEAWPFSQPHALNKPHTASHIAS